MARSQMSSSRGFKMKSWTLRGVVLAIAVVAWGKALPASATSPADPCQSSAVVKHSVPMSIIDTGSPQVVELVPASSQTIHVCGFMAVSSGGLTFEYGSGLDCSTGTVALTGSLGTVTYSGPGTIFSVPANNGLCVTEGSALGGFSRTRGRKTDPVCCFFGSDAGYTPPGSIGSVRVYVGLVTVELRQAERRCRSVLAIRVSIPHLPRRVARR
jgi:hypothetical protein